VNKRSAEPVNSLELLLFEISLNDGLVGQKKHRDKTTVRSLHDVCVSHKGISATLTDDGRSSSFDRVVDDLYGSLAFLREE
jgi:hypothetical protein